MGYIINAAGLTDVGLRRGHNEDCILVVRDLGLFAVADGMGGHAAGEVASNTAINQMMEFVQAHRDGKPPEKNFDSPAGLDGGALILHDAVMSANRILCAMAEGNTAYGGMGTTIASLYFDGENLFVAHVGDSRVYRIRKRRLEPLTQDHSWVNEQLKKNCLTEDEARTHRWRNVITRALGNRVDVEVDVNPVEVEDHNLFLLCSDGVTSMVSDEQIEDFLSDADLQDLDALSEDIVYLANEAGGHDNISVVVLRLTREGAEPEMDEPRMNEPLTGGSDDGGAALILDDEEESDQPQQVSLSENMETPPER